MSKTLRSGTLLLPVLLSLLTLTTFLFAGCGERPGEGEPPIDYDSVKPHIIPIQLAAYYTQNFRASVDSFNQKCPTFKDSMRFGHAEAFPSDLYRLLLKQKDSTGALARGIRIYYGRGPDGQIKMVLIPYDKNGNDIINHMVSTDEKQVPGVSPARNEKTANTASSSSSNGQAGEQGQLCPTACSADSPLN